MPILTIIEETPPPLATAQALVGGYVELITLPNGDQMLVDEDGKLKHLEINDAASLIAWQIIVGPAVLLKGKARWT